MPIDDASRLPESSTRPVPQGTLQEVPPAPRSATRASIRSTAETIRLAPGARLVPPSLLVPPFTNERRGILHDQAAALLNRYLRRLARMRNPVELRIARLLGRMKRLSAYLDLGFARMTDYAVERLGLSARRAQILLQIDDGLRRLPEIARAYESARLSHSQVLLLLRVATPATEPVWLEKAGSMNVRKLEQEVRRARAALAQERAGASPSDAAPDTTAPSIAPPTAPPTGSATTGSTTPLTATASHEATIATAAALTIDPSPLDEDNDAPLVQVSFPAPDWLRGQWDWAVEVFRRTAGAAAPVWQATEGFAAEYLSGLPQPPPNVFGIADDAASADGACGAGVGADATAAGAASPDDTFDVPTDTAGLRNETAGCPDDSAGFPNATPSCPDDRAGLPNATAGCPESTDADAGLELFEEVQRAIEDELGVSKWAPSAEDMKVTLPHGLDAPDTEEDPPGDAASLDHRLRGLIDIRQNLDWHQGRLLRTFANYRLYRALGFESFSRYCRENLGMSVRRARCLITLARRLIELPDLERAYRNGELSWVKAFEIARVAQPETEKAWIHLGASVTVRRLREEVALALADMENDALPWDALRGLPRGLGPDGRVQLCAPSIQPPPKPGSDPASDSAPGPASNSPTDPGVQMSAPAEPDPSPADPASLPANPGVQTSAPASEGNPAPSPADSAPFPANPGVQTSARSNRITTRIHFRAPEGVAQLWRQTLAACRAVNGDHLQNWECVAQMLESFRRTWDLRGSAAWRRRYRIFERDGWRCRVPGCSSRRNLNAHHVVFRSEGGGGEDDNLVTVCVTHHLRCLHSGSLRCHRLPDGLLAWEFGASPGATTPGNEPMARFVEEVVWEAARDAVRSRDDKAADNHHSATRPCDRPAPEHHPASQQTRSEAAPRVTIDSTRTTPPQDGRLNMEHAPA